MKWSYLSLLIAGLLPVICAGIAKAGRKDYDNRDPRAWMATQTGYRARANAAQANSLEAFPFFAAGVLLALMAGVDEAIIDVACLVFIAARLAYILAYVGGPTKSGTIRDIQVKRDGQIIQAAIERARLQKEAAQQEAARKQADADAGKKA